MRTGKVAEIKIGDYLIQGILFTDTQETEFGVALTQVSEQFGFVKYNAQRDVKALLGKGFGFVKCKVEGVNERWNVITLLDYEKLLLKLDRKGNETAQLFRDSLVGLSLHQLFHDAFTLVFSEEAKQQLLLDRQKGIVARKEFTEAVKIYSERTKTTPNYARYTNETKRVLGFPLDKGHRNKCSSEELREYEKAETIITHYILALGYDPSTAIRSYAKTIYPPDLTF